MQSLTAVQRGGGLEPLAPGIHHEDRKVMKIATSTSNIALCS